MAVLSQEYERGGRTISVERAKEIIAAFDPAIETAFFIAGMMECLRAHKLKQQYRPMTGEARERTAISRRRCQADKEYCRAHRIHPSELIQHKLKNAVAVIQENGEKAAKYDKVVELLDTWTVGDTRLGECTKTKLLAEAAKHDRTAADLTVHATVYKKLAGHMRDGETVRTSTKRTTMLDILLALKPA